GRGPGGTAPGGEDLRHGQGAPGAGALLPAREPRHAAGARASRGGRIAGAGHASTGDPVRVPAADRWAGDGLYVLLSAAGCGAASPRLARRGTAQHRLVRGLRGDTAGGAGPDRLRGPAAPPRQHRARPRSRGRGRSPPGERPSARAPGLRTQSQRGPDADRPVAPARLSPAARSHRGPPAGPGGDRHRRPGRSAGGGAGMTLRSRLLIAQAPLAIALAAMAALSVSTTGTLGHAGERILADNYRSVLAAQRMKESIERLDSGALFIVIGERERGLALATEHRPSFE